MSVHTPFYESRRNVILLVLVMLGVLAYSSIFVILSNQLTAKPKVITPTIIPSPIPGADSTANWKTYTNTRLGLLIQYPSNLFIVKENDLEMEFSSIKKDNLKYYFEPSTNIKWDELYESGFYSVTLSVDDNPVYQTPYTIKKEPVTEKNLVNLLGTVEKKPIEKELQRRTMVGTDRTFVVGKLNQIGGGYDYYILDGTRVIHLHASSYNLKKVSLDQLNQILQTFRFTK